jgi:hypothetical protein
MSVKWTPLANFTHILCVAFLQIKEITIPYNVTIINNYAFATIIINKFSNPTKQLEFSKNIHLNKLNIDKFKSKLLVIKVFAFANAGFKVVKVQDLIADLEGDRITTDQIQDTVVIMPSAELSRARGGFHCMSMPINRE